MKHLHRIVLSNVLLGLPAIAASPIAPLRDDPEYIDLVPFTKTWPTLASVTDIGRAISADFTGDRTPDVWQQTGNALILFINPGYMDCTAQLNVAASSMARFPGATAVDQSRLLYADATGVHLVDYDALATPALSTTSVSLSSTWNNAKSLQVYDLNGDGHLDLMAIKAAGTKLLRAMSDGQGGWNEAAELNLGSGATEAFPMVYEVGQPIQIAVLTTSWMFITKQDGVRTKLIATQSTFGHIAKISQIPSSAGPVPDCVAWLRDDPNDTGQHLEFIDNSVEPQDPVPVEESDLTDIDASTLFSGDMNDDGSDDVGVVSRNTRIVYSYYNRRDFDEVTVDRFQNPWSRAVSIASDTELGDDNTSTPVVGDLNFDRTADFFVVDRNVCQALALLTDPDLPPETSSQLKAGCYGDAEHACIERGDYYSAIYLDQYCGLAPWTGVLMLSIKNPWAPALDPAHATGWFLDLVMYQQTPGEDVELDAVAHYQYDLSGAPIDYRDEAPDEAVWSFPIRVGQAVDIFSHRYYIVLRPLPPNEGPPLEEFAVGVTCENLNSEPPGHDSMIYLTGLPGAWPYSTCFDHWIWNDEVCQFPGGGDSRKDAAGTVPLLEIPPFKPGVPNPQQPPYPAAPPLPVPRD